MKGNNLGGYKMLRSLYGILNMDVQWPSSGNIERIRIFFIPSSVQNTI